MIDPYSLNRKKDKESSETERKAKKKKTEKILVLIDWDNLFLNLINIFKPGKVNLSFRLDKLKEWLGEIGEIWAVFVFAPPHLSPWHRKLLRQHGFFLITCDKIKPEEKTKEKTGDKKEIDTVDETLIRFGELELPHPDIDYLCLVSGDFHFAELLEKAQKSGKKRAIVISGINPLARKLIAFADQHPKTKRKMILRLDEV